MLMLVQGDLAEQSMLTAGFFEEVEPVMCWNETWLMSKDLLNLLEHEILMTWHDTHKSPEFLGAPHLVC